MDDNIPQLFENNVLTLAFLKDGDDFYWAEALPGSDLEDEVWRAYKYDAANGRILLADGNANFDNAADDLKTLTYE
jgi:hypothetical protein